MQFVRVNQQWFCSCKSLWGFIRGGSGGPEEAVPEPPQGTLQQSGLRECREIGSGNWNIPVLPGGVGCLSFLPKEEDDSCSPAFCSRHSNHKNEIIWKGRELKSAALSWMLLFSGKNAHAVPSSLGETGIAGDGMG